MKLKEYQGKEIFKKYGINVPNGYVITDVSQIQDDKMSSEIILKAQLLAGGRGKAGGIKFANFKNVKELSKELFQNEINGLKVNEILVEDKVLIQHEYYLSITVNRSDKCLTLIFSKKGGVDIESVSSEDIVKINFYDLKNEDVQKEMCEKITDKNIRNIADKMYKLMKEKDAELVEINPLVVTFNNEYIACDSKIIIDDNALFRQEEFLKEEELTDIEKEAKKYDLAYVELLGDIAIIGNGAGLVMSTLDVVNYFGGKPANFLDVGGGANVEKMEHALRIVLMKNVKGVLINIFGGITRCDEIASGLVNYISKNNVNIPIVVRMIGTNENLGKEILKKSGIDAYDSMEECAKKIVEVIK